MPTHLLGPIIADAKAGRFAAALQRTEEVEAGITNAELPVYRVVKAEMLRAIGRGTEAEELAEKTLLACDLEASLCSRCHVVLGGAHYERGHLSEALRHLHRGVRLAEESQDTEQICWAQLNLISTLADVSTPEAVVSLAKAAQRNTARSGDPRIAASLHICIGRLEAKRGSVQSATHHVTLASSILRRHPNIWLEGVLQLDICGIEQIRNQFENVVESARVALACAEESGHRRTLLGALANLGQAKLYLGEFDDANLFLTKALAKASGSTNVHLALLDSYAQLKLTQGRLDECQALLDDIDRLNPPRDRYQPSWLDLWIHQTRIRLLQGRERWVEAADVASTAIGIASAREDRRLGALFRILKADSITRLGRFVEAGELLADATAACDSGSLDTSAEIARVTGIVLARQGAPSAAARHFDRAHRIADSIGNACLRMRIDADRQIALPPHAASSLDVAAGRGPEQPETTHHGELDGVTLLLEFAGRPDLMGRELLHLLDRLAYPGRRWVARRTAEGTYGPQAWSGSPVPDSGPAPDPTDTPPCDTHEIALDDDGAVLLVEPPTSFAATDTLATVRKLVAQARELERASQQKRRRASFWETEPAAATPGGVFVSRSMMEVLSTARQAAPTDIPVLLTGETGTGKELLARAIHDSSARASRTFLPFDCNSVPRDLLDSQLFGHRRGAFTGATEQFPGVIRAAEGGTLFLDEIGELSPEVQPKLLRFLETRHVHPLGASSPIPVDVRIVAATNADLDRLVSEGTFREDLYYRLNVIRLPLPPLRERREEIPPLAQHFLELHAEDQGRAPARLSDEALEYLLLHRWPGNVRELGNEMRRLVAFAEPGSIIAPELLSSHIRASRRTVPTEPERPAEAVQVSLRQPMAAATDELERAMIGHALARTGGRVEPAARLLGLSRKGLYLKRQRLQLDSPEP